MNKMWTLFTISCFTKQPKNTSCLEAIQLMGMIHFNYTCYHSSSITCALFYFFFQLDFVSYYYAYSFGLISQLTNFLRSYNDIGPNWSCFLQLTFRRQVRHIRYSVVSLLVVLKWAKGWSDGNSHRGYLAVMEVYWQTVFTKMSAKTITEEDDCSLGPGPGNQKHDSKHIAGIFEVRMSS